VIVWIFLNVIMFPTQLGLNMINIKQK